MELRGFLKALAEILVSPAIKIPEFRLATPDESLIEGETWFSTIQEFSAYDISEDRMMLRYDVLGTRDFVSVTFWESPVEIAKKGVKSYRGMAAKLLKEEMDKRGMLLSELKPIQIPSCEGSGFPVEIMF